MMASGMSTTRTLLFFLLLLLERVKPKNPSLSWDPNITTFQDMDNESLIVNVQPAVRPIHYLQVCITKASSIPCQGNIFRMESAKNMFRYGVMDLEGNQSYYVYVRPFDENDDALDVWIHKQEPIFLKPWPEEALSTTTTTTTSANTKNAELVPPQPPPQRATLGVVVGLVVIILLLLMAVIITCVMWRRGCLQKIWFRFPQTAFGGRPIRVVQLYEKESEQFRRLVKTHMQYLSQYVNLDVRDCEALGDQFHVDHWLEQSCTLLVYMSPQLRNQLRMLDPEMHYSSSHLMTRKVSLIYRMIAASDRQKGRSRRARVIFILPRCWSCSDDMEEYLNQHETLGRLPCFYISSPPGALLNKLSGCHQSLLSACRSSSARSQELSNTINTLLQMIRVGQDQYLAGAQLNGHANLQMMCGAYDYELDHNAHSTVMPPCIRATGHPHRTDSGFSSSTDHHHGGSNPSSEHNSPGEQYEEEGTETDPMMQSQANCLPYSASEMSLSFVPPESVVGDVDSIIMDDRCRRLNDQGDW